MSGYEDYQLSADTTPEAEKLMFELLEKKSPAERIRMVSQMCSTVRTLAMSGLRERYPEANEQDLKIKFAELLYGADIAEEIVKKLRNCRK